jgi:CRP/FNR family transcriptional regulator
LTSEELDLLNRSKTTRTYRPRQVIFHDDSPCLGVYCIESGTVALKKVDAQCKEQILRLCQVGETLGYRAYFADLPHEATAEAIADSRICFIPREVVRELLGHNPALGYHFLRRFALELGEVEDRMIAHRSLPVRARLAHLLLVLKDRFDRVDESGDIVMELPLSRTDLAALIGARPESLSRAIRSLEEAGVAKFDGRILTIRDVDGLLDEVELDRG